VEDAFTFYVMIIGIPESTFWESDERFLDAVAADKAAYDGWLGYAQRKEAEAGAKR